MMKKAFIFATLMTMMSPVYAVSIMAEYKKLDVEFDDFSSDLTGASVGIASSPNGKEVQLWASVESLTEDHIDVLTVDLGVAQPIFQKGGLSLIGRLGMGYGSVDIDVLPNSNTIFTALIGVEADYAFNKNFSVYGGAGYKLIYDLTDPTTCNDGSTSGSVGSGTCSHHGGIDAYNYEIGDATATELRVGIRYNF